jgi:hypothetical protein
MKLDFYSRVYTKCFEEGAKAFLLDGGASLQVVLDLLGVLAVEALQLLVELHVPLVDVI